MAWRRAGKIGFGALVGGGAVVGAAFFCTDYRVNQSWAQKCLTVAHALDKSDLLKERPTKPLPARGDMLKSLKSEEPYDVLIIGGGASGAGIALDAQTRGLRTALVEYEDFAAGTSSRSTKLIHGGVRYLQAAILRLDLEQYRMVKEALHERANLLQIAPHLSHPLPIMLPVYKWWQVPYFWAGIKMYDFVAGKRVVKPSYFIGKSKTLDLFPMLRKDNLVGAIIYYDGQHDDARMNLSIILTAVRHGADCVNHVAVTDLLKDESGKLCGAKVKDRISGEEWKIKAKSVINATGPFIDNIRLMDDPSATRLCVQSAGVHVVLPGYYSPEGCGLLDPATKDGRVVFFLPWEKMTIAGTTDSPSALTHSPAPANHDVQFILDEIKHYLSPDISVRRGDVLSAWAGLRPLVRDLTKKDTASLARNHIIEVSDSKLITIGGGKWTTYRQMAEETVDSAVSECGLSAERACVTTGLPLEGAHLWNPLMYIRLVQDYGLEVDVAKHLTHAYGDRALSVAKLAKVTGKRWPIAGVKLHPEFPYIEAEVKYAMREYAMSATDVIARRMRLSFLNTHAANEALPRVVEIMANEYKWSRAEQKRQLEEAQTFIRVEMGRDARRASLENRPLDLTGEEVAEAKRKFAVLDRNGTGKITVNDLRRHFKDRGEKIDESMLHELLGEVDLNRNGEVEMIEFLQLYSGMKHGQIAASRFLRFVYDEASPSIVNKSLADLRRAAGDL